MSIFLRTLFTGPILVIMFALFFHSTAFAADKTLRIAVDAPYPPFAYIDEETQQLVGFDVEIMQALCNQMKRKCEFIIVGFDDIIPEILLGNIDIGIAGMARTPVRELDVNFSDKYFHSSSIFIELPGKNTLTREGLTGKTLATQADTIQEEYLRKTYGDIATIKTYPSFLDTLTAVKNEEVDIAFIDGLAGYHQLKTEFGMTLDILGNAIALNDDACIVLNKNLKAEQTLINEAIKAIRANGTFAKINRKYFEFNIY